MNKKNKTHNKILMLVYSHLPGDTRVRREADALITCGYKVDVLCLKDEDEDSREVFEGINIYRMNLKKTRGSFLDYFYKYFIFFIWSFVKLSILFIKNRYDFIHVHNMPNFIVFAALIPKLSGKKIILDQHDAAPELLMAMTNKTEGSFLFKLAVSEEKLSTWFANHVITTNIAFKDLFLSRGCKEEKITIVMNSPQTSIFNNVIIPKLEPKNHGTKNFKIMYHGTIIKRHGLGVLIDSVKILKDKIPDIEVNIFGLGEYLPEILQKINLLNLNEYVKYRGAFLLDKIAAIIPTMDLGVIPNRFNAFTNVNFPVRIFEYLFFKKPVIVPKTRGIKDYFSEDSIFYFKPEDPINLAEVILSVYYKSEELYTVINNGYKVYQNYTWEIQSKNLLEVYDKSMN